MYTEEYEKRGFPIRNFILKLILVIIFVFLLVWLLPKFLSPTINNNKSSKSNKGNTACVSETCDYGTGINALTSQIFADNIEKMKDAAISYYTEERLPKEVNQTETMTLSDMIGKKIITPLIDRNNKAVDVEKSYVRITKLDDEYLLKVNIKDSEKEDYILVHLGCYNYCKSFVCQKEQAEIPAKGSKVVGGYVPVKGSIDQGVIYIPSDPEPVVETHKCVVIGNNYYDKYGRIVSVAAYKKSCGIEDKYYCKVVDGKFYDKFGHVVSEAAYKKSCGIEDKHYCVEYQGKFYDKNGNIVSEAEYKRSCGIDDKHYCVVYDGKFYGPDGTVVSEETYRQLCESSEVEYLYEYKKTTGAEFSAWTKWSAWKQDDCNTPEINCSDNDTQCLKKLQMYKRKEEIGTYERTYARERDMLVQVGQYTQKACSKYNYVIINNKTYATTTTTTYTQINTVTTTTTIVTGGWVKVGSGSYSNPPSDSPGNHYVFTGADYSYCGASCTSLPNYYYDQYQYTGGLTSVSSTTTPGPITSTTTTETTLISDETTTEASCGEYVTKTVPVYRTIRVTEKAKREEPLYGTVCYTSTKTRDLISAGKTVYKWSTFDDQALLNAGWIYTGNKREK